jgi:hypothetical protein
MTSLASLAANSTSHPPTSGIMSTSLTSTNTAAASANVDLLNDTNYEIKTEFYTREGIWKLAPGGEYARQAAPTQATTGYQVNSSLTNTNSSAQSLNYASSTTGGLGGNAANSSLTGSGIATSNVATNNDPVRIACFKFSKNILNNATNTDNLGLPVRRIRSKTCRNCTKQRSNQHKSHVDDHLYDLNDNEDDEDDDDDDVICSKVRDEFNSSFSSNIAQGIASYQYYCKYCNSNLTADGELLPSDLASPTLDMLLFNYSREIYFYEFSPIYSTVIKKNSLFFPTENDNS